MQSTSRCEARYAATLAVCSVRAAQLRQHREVRTLRVRSGAPKSIAVAVRRRHAGDLRLVWSQSNELSTYTLGYPWAQFHIEHDLNRCAEQLLDVPLEAR